MGKGNIFKAFATLVVMIGLLSAGWADTASVARAKKSDEILAKIHEIDLLNQMLPLLMTKEQMRKLLPDVEKARDVVRKTQEEEYKALLKLETSLDEMIKDAYGKGKIATDEQLKATGATLAKMRTVRKALSDLNAGTIMAKMKTILDKGQLAAARNALTPNLLDPSLDPTKLDDDGKLLFFVRWIFLDPQAYDVLLKLSK